MTYLLLLLALALVAGVNAALGGFGSASRIWLRHRADLGGRGRNVAQQFL